MIVLQQCMWIQYLYFTNIIYVDSKKAAAVYVRVERKFPIKPSSESTQETGNHFRNNILLLTIEQVVAGLELFNNLQLVALRARRWRVARPFWPVEHAAIFHKVRYLLAAPYDQILNQTTTKPLFAPHDTHSLHLDRFLIAIIIIYAFVCALLLVSDGAQMDDKRWFRLIASQHHCRRGLCRWYSSMANSMETCLNLNICIAFAHIVSRYTICTLLSLQKIVC